MSRSGPVVVVDLLGSQTADPSEAGTAAVQAALWSAVAEEHPRAVDEFVVHVGHPVPGPVARLIGSVSPTLLGTQRTWDPHETGTFVTGAIGRTSLTSVEVIPPRFNRAGWRRVGLVLDVGAVIGDPTACGLARSMDRLLVPTSTSAERLVDGADVVADRVTVIGTAALGPRPTDDGDRGRREEHNKLFPVVAGLHTPYVLAAVEDADPAEARAMVERFARVPAEQRAWVQLVVAGPVDPATEVALVAAGRDHGLDLPVLVPGRLDDETLARLLGTARVVCTSTVEPGRLTATAAAWSTPVVAPEVTALTEALAEAPGSPLTGCRPVEIEPVAAVAGRVAAALSESREAEPPRTRPRIAVVSPVPPQPSGIADYTARLLPHIGARVDVEVFAQDPGSGDVAGFPVHPTPAFTARDRARGFDRIVVMVGNSPHHVDAADLIAEYGGVVVLHDARLAGLYAAAVADPGHPIDHVGALAAATYPGRYDASVEERTLVDPATADAVGLQLLQHVVSAADEVLVHSRFAADICEIDTGRRPLIAFGLPFDQPTSDRRPVPGRIVTAGHLTPVKRPEVLLDAVTALRAEGRDVSLAFAGGGADDYVGYLTAEAEARGLADRVVVHGFVSDAEYRSALAEAEVAVQLRAFTNGESSAAVHDTLAMGVPTVVNRLGAQAELPSDAVAFVRADADAAEVAAAIGRLLDDPVGAGTMSVRARELASAGSYAATVEALLGLLGL